MRRVDLLVTMVWCLAAALRGQTPPSHLVSDAYRTEFELNAGRILAAADDMPANRYTFRPTRAQMSFAEVVMHVAEGNDDIGAVVGDTTAPQRRALVPTEVKAVLVARLRSTFEFSRAALARLNDSMLANPVPEYGTRAQALFNTINHWSDHYSQMAIYLRLNGVLPPTARGAGRSPAGTRADSTTREDERCGGAMGRGAARPDHHGPPPSHGEEHNDPVGVGQIAVTPCRSAPARQQP